MRAIPEFTDPDARLALMDRMHIHAIVNFPTLASLIEVNFMDDPGRHPGADPRLQPVDVRRVGLQPRGPHLHHAGDEPLDPRGRRRRARVGARAWRQDRPRAAGPRRRLPGPALAVPPRQRPVLGRPSRRPASRSCSTPRTPATRASPTSGTARRGEMRPFEQDLFYARVAGPPADHGHHLLGRLPRHALPLPRRAPRHHRERQRVDRPASSRTSLDGYGKMPHLFAEHPLDTLQRALYVAPYWEDAARAADRRHRPRPHPVQLRLAPPRGPRRPRRVRRLRPRRSRPRRRATSPRSWAGTCTSS